MTPSVKTIMAGLGVARDKATKVRNIMSGNYNPFDYSDFQSLKASHRDCLAAGEKKLVCLNQELKGFGVEFIAMRGSLFRGMHYVNTGDGYKNTVILETSPSGQRFIVAAWSDIVEKNPNRFE